MDNEKAIKASFVGNISRGTHINFIGSTSSRWAPPPYNTIKLNVVWSKGKAYLIALAKNYDVEFSRTWV